MTKPREGGRSATTRWSMNNADIAERRAEALPKGLSSSPVFAASANNATITDVEGREFIDFAGGIGVMNVGHCHPKVMAAVHDQVDRFSHTCFSVFSYEPFVALAEKMNESVPGPSRKKTFFANSGAEAVENAIKVARAATGRKSIVAFENAFHGRTNLAMGLTSKVSPYKKDFGPFTPGIYRIPYAYCYRCPLNLGYPGCGVECAELLKAGFDKDYQADEVACVIVEPVQGEGGFIVPPREYHARLKEICEQNGILYIADEVQTGFGRTGKFFAIEHFGIEPDVMTTAKSLGAGYPISAITGKADYMDAPVAGGIGGTYGGNPAACRAGLAVFEIFKEEGLADRANEVGNRVRARFEAMQAAHECVGDVRGLGAMMALELVEDRVTKKPATALAKAYRAKLFQNGLVNVGAGTYDNVIRTLMPLTIEFDVLERVLDIMEQTLFEVVGSA